MHPTVGKAIAGGLAGTVVMTMMMYFVAPMMGLNMDIASMLGSMMGIGWFGGMLVHFLNGTVIFPLIYVFAIHRLLPGSATIRGTAWGIILWLVAQVVVMPMMGAGVFSSAAGGMMAAAGSLVGHLLYGGLLGAIAGDAAPSHGTSPFSARA